MMATKSASNAVKHGLTSRTFVPDHAREFVESIRLDLTALHQPQPGEESNLVAELAVALWQNYEHDRRFYERESYEKAAADGLFLDQATDKCRDDLAGLRTSPMLHRIRLSHSYLGTLHLQGLFQSTMATLSQEMPVSFQQITDCINAMGEDWRLETLSGSASYLMGLHLALVENPEAEIDQWMTQSQPASAERAGQLARYHHAQAPSAEKARTLLLARLARELADVDGRLDQLKEQFEERRRLFKAANAGFGLHDPKATRAAMLAMRYRTAAYNRSARLEKELDRRKKERAERSPHSVYSYRLPAQPAASAAKPQVYTHKEFKPEQPTPAITARTAAPAPLRNETAPTPANTLVTAHPGHKKGIPPMSNRKKQLARLARQAK